MCSWWNGPRSMLLSREACFDREKLNVENSGSFFDVIPLPRFTKMLAFVTESIGK